MQVSQAELQTLSRLLDELLDTPASARAGWIDALEAQDVHLANTLRDMLSRDSPFETKDFLKTLPKFEVAEASDDESLPAGQIVGPYRLIREIGRGGMSTVWLAERADGAVKRPIALKLPHAGSHGAQFAERLVRERVILGSLTHPHIARLYDAGVSVTGQPYLAADYVDGVTITEFCDQAKLNVRERIQLFLQVLGAVQFAHAQLVIHRDLKPSNILVTAQRQAVLIDFGIAKLLVEGAAEDTELTLHNGRVMTLRYASPEQITHQPIGTASDTYSLGVLLFERLTGALPYKLKRESRGALEDAIVTGELPRPSACVASTQVAEQRATTARRLRALLQGDLDTVVLKALKKAPAERYATVDAFAQDLQRYLVDEPVLAAPDSKRHRANLFLRRHLLGIAVATAIFVSLSAGLAVAYWQWARAAAQAQVAESEARTSRAVQGFLQDIFRANSSEQADPVKARTTTARQLLDIGRVKIDYALADAPLAKADVLSTLASMYQDLGLIDDAIALARTRLQVTQQHYGKSATATAAAMIDLAGALESSSSVAERAALLRDAGRILDTNGDTTSPTRAALLRNLADEYYDHDLGRAMNYVEQAATIMRGRPPSDNLTSTLVSLAVMCGFSGDAARGEAAYKEALANSLRLHPGGDSERPQIYTYLGDVQRDQQRFTEAERSYRAAAREARAIGNENEFETVRADHGLGLHLFLAGQTREGLALMASAKARILNIRGPEDSLITPWIMTGYAYGQLRSGNFENALRDLQKIEANQRKYRPGGRVLALVLERKAWALSIQGRVADALGALDEAASIHAQIHEQGADLNSHQLVRARVFLAADRVPEAVAALAKVRVTQSAHTSISTSALQVAIAEAAAALAEHRVTDAIHHAAQAQGMLVASPAGAFFPHESAEALVLAGKAALAAHDDRSAQPLLEQGVTQLTQLYDATASPELADADVALAQCQLDLGNRAIARSLLTKAAAIQHQHTELSPHFTKPLQTQLARLGRVTSA